MGAEQVRLERVVDRRVERDRRRTVQDEIDPGETGQVVVGQSEALLAKVAVDRRDLRW